MLNQPKPQVSSQDPKLDDLSQSCMQENPGTSYLYRLSQKEGFQRAKRAEHQSLLILCLIVWGLIITWYVVVG